MKPILKGITSKLSVKHHENTRLSLRKAFPRKENKNKIKKTNKIGIN